METSKLALGSWAFVVGPYEREPWSFERVLHFAADVGYEGIEISGFHPHPHCGVFDSDEKCAALRSHLDELNLGISGYAPDLREFPPAFMKTVDYLEVIEKCLRFCNRMEIPVLRVDTVSPPAELDDTTYSRIFASLVDTWQAAAEICRQAGVILVWEFEPGFWLNKPSEVLNLLNAVNHSHFKVLFDTSHAYMGAVVGARQTGEKEILPGGIIEYAQMLEGRIGHLHLIDSDGTLYQEDETSKHTPFGEGLIDFPAFFQAGKEWIGQLEWWCVDFCFCSTTEKDAPTAIPFIRKIIDQVS